jgi:NAD(P)-dependent dehydrogenase (short-subunit alcohol dehydrogenase family)
VTPVIEKIQKLNSAIKVSFVRIELDDFDSVRKAADAVNGLVTKVDILINNAGVMAIPNFTTNKNGIESQFATNHLGHFLLTALIFPKILAAGKGARIVNLTSDGYMIGPCRFEDYNFQDGAEYDGWSAYGQAKTANILFTRQLSTKIASRGIFSFAVHPGGKLLEPGRSTRIAC